MTFPNPIAQALLDKLAQLSGVLRAEYSDLNDLEAASLPGESGHRVTCYMTEEPLGYRGSMILPDAVINNPEQHQVLIDRMAGLLVAFSPTRRLANGA